MIEDPITFEVIKNALVSSAREMSQALRRTAFSPNIKERRDCSCAIFDAQGRLTAQSKDIPVHLGAMPMSVKACITELNDQLIENTMALVNDPFSGGSHLPDLTLVAPIFNGDERVAFVANRAHHADVGGISPGSMPGMSLSIHEEGTLIKPRIVFRENKLDSKTISDLIENTRTPNERIGDLSAQIAANIVGRKRLVDVAKQHSWPTLIQTFDELRYYSESRMKHALSKYDGLKGSFLDMMDSDGAGNFEIPIKVDIQIRKEKAIVDFEGTANQVEGNINCPIASSLSSVYFVFIALLGKDIPTNEGCWSVLDVRIPKRSLLNPEFPAAVSAGNVETSQRIVDVTLGAMAEIVDFVPAASQGTMNNLTMGGIDPRTGTPFSFYETIGGGVGASRGIHGSSGVHSHMTNTLNTPVESLETEYPLRILKYSIRRGSGGKGLFDGGDGIIREIEILADDCFISIQSERRTSQPWGICQGYPGMSGRNSLRYLKQEYELQSKTSVKTLNGSIVKIETPGGGAWGKIREEDESTG